MPATLKQQTLPDLEYDYHALEPAISGQIMEIHHAKHHQTYINNYNALAEKHEAARAKDDLPAMLALQPGLNFNGGGHVNHSLFWENLAPQSEGGGAPPTGPLADAINAQWGSLETFIEKFNSQTAPIQGSGWGWLAYCPQNKRLEIATCANQDPLSTKGLIPLLGVDVWEHAYYLQYLNVRPAYLKAIWQVVNWKRVAKRYQTAI